MPHPLPPEPSDEKEAGIPLDHPLYAEQLNKAMQERAHAELAGGIGASTVMDHRPTVSEQLAMRKAHLEHELKLVNEAIAHALNNTPTMALLDSISKVGIGR